jgi:lipopolysaccharide export system permease protein
MVSTFDRHILKRFMLSALMLIGALIVFFIVLHYVEYVDDFMDRGATMREVFAVYYPHMIPEIIKLTTPLAVFMSCVYLTGRLAQQLQLAALQTSGVSLQRLLAPYLTVAVAVTCVMFWFDGFVVPKTNAVVLEFEERYLKDAPRQLDVNDIHRQEGPETVVTVGFYQKDSGTAHRVSLQTYAEGQRLTMRIDALRMQWVDSLRIWRFQSAVRRHFRPDGSETRAALSTLDTTLSVFPRDFARSESDVEAMTIPVAKEYIESLERAGADNLGRARVAYYSKFSYPMASLILVLIGVPLAAVRRRGGQAVQIAIGLFIAFVYLAMIKVIEPFGYSESLSPVIASWLPHAFFSVVGLAFLIGARK